MRDPSLTQIFLSVASGALGVAINAALSLAEHARSGSVKWRCGGMYAAPGSARHRKDRRRPR